MMFRLYDFYLLVVFLLLGMYSLGLNAQVTIVDSTLRRSYVIQENQWKHNLKPAIDMLKDGGDMETIEELLEQEDNLAFIPLDEERIPGNHTIWLRVSVHSEVTIDKWWLLFKREPPLSYVTYHDEAYFYFVRNGKVIREAVSGTMMPASVKDIKEELSTVRVYASFEAGAVTDVYVKVYDTEVLFPNLELRNPELGLPPVLENTPNWGLIVIKHFFFIIGCYVLLLFFFVRDYSYLYLLGMIFFIWTHYHILQPHSPFVTYLIPEKPHWVETFWIFLTMGSHAFYFQFGRTYTNLKLLNSRLDRIIKWYIGLLIAVIVIRISFQSLSKGMNTDFENYVMILIFLCAIGLIIRLSFIKNVLVRYYVFGGLWLTFFSIIGILWNLDIIPFFNNPNPWMIAQGGFILINALAIGRKIQLSERAKLEVEKVKEIDAIKSRFFTNISHELRTPLSLILGPIDQSLEHVPSSDLVDDTVEVPVKGKHLKLIRRNTIRLKHLVDQILDLSKLEDKKMKLKLQCGDVIHFIRLIVHSFESQAERKNIHFHTTFPPPEKNAIFDKDKLEKILVNLLSNAFKFTPHHGTISVSVHIENDLLRIMVSDTGKGMAVEEINSVFDRFYQVETTHDTGTGIGLALVKELVELYRGQIAVESRVDKGTVFKVSIPFQESSFSKEHLFFSENSLPSINQERITQLLPEVQGVEEKPQENTDFPLALVVEDNPDLLDYICESISATCTVLKANNGQMGIDLAIAHIPDIIISDIMMPERNGYELCDALKKDKRTDHVPVILLTAKAEQDDKITGLLKGADAYLTKPFDRQELQVRIANLLEIRRKLRDRFSQEFTYSSPDTPITSVEHRFLTSVKNQIEKEMGNEFFTVEDLARGVGFSRSQLSRKIKALTGKTSNQLIREFRLNRAKMLIEQNSASISEIAYEVGYSNLSYFSKSYKEEFGIVPSETNR